jgi:hypothetical protein
MTGHDDASGSLRTLAVHLRRLGLHARLGCGPCPALEVANPLSVAVSATVGVTGGCYVAFDGMVLAAAGEPRAAASRLAYLLGLIRV